MSVFPEPTSSIADASAAAAQKKKQYETLTRGENRYLKRVNNLIDVLGLKDKIVTSHCDRVEQKFVEPNFFPEIRPSLQNFCCLVRPAPFSFIQCLTARK